MPLMDTSTLWYLGAGNRGMRRKLQQREEPGYIIWNSYRYEAVTGG